MWSRHRLLWSAELRSDTMSWFEVPLMSPLSSSRTSLRRKRWFSPAYSAGAAWVLAGVTSRPPPEGAGGTKPAGGPAPARGGPCGARGSGAHPPPPALRPPRPRRRHRGRLPPLDALGALPSERSGAVGAAWRAPREAAAGRRGAAMYGLARALRRAAGPGRPPAPRRGGGGVGARPWGWGLALGLALGVKVPTPAGCEADGGQEVEVKPLPPPRGFGAAIERSRDLLRRIKVLRERGWRERVGSHPWPVLCEPARRGEAGWGVPPVGFSIAVRRLRSSGGGGRSFFGGLREESEPRRAGGARACRARWVPPRPSQSSP